MQGSPLILFCFPCAGASATAYLRWRRLVPSWLRIEPVEPPGRGSRMGENLIHDFSTLVDDLTARIRPLAIGRYAFFGHSMGALLAYGCASRLVERGAPSPLALAVAAAAAPSRRVRTNAAGKSEAELIADLRRFNGAPDFLFDDPQMLALTLETLAADYDVCASFKSRSASQLNCRIFVYGGEKDAIAEYDLAAWSCESLKETSISMFSGGHFFLREQEKLFLKKLLSDISSAFSVN